jgi:hypothetical protein
MFNLRNERSRKTEVRRRKSGETGVRGKTEDRRQESEDRRQKSEAIVYSSLAEGAVHSPQPKPQYTLL